MKKALYIVSFGTSVDEAWKAAIKPTQKMIKEHFSGMDHHTAITSRKVYSKLKDRGLAVHYVEEGLEHLHQTGYGEIYLQPLHLLAGFEYDKIREAADIYEAKGMRIHLSSPLLCSEAHVPDVAQALLAQFPEEGEAQEENRLKALDRTILLVGHGTEHRANRWYEALEDELNRLGQRVLVGTIEEGAESVIDKLQAAGISRVLLMPFLLVAGDHVLNDLFGDEADSWINRLRQAGVSVEGYKKGIGENPKVQALYVKRLEAKMKEAAECTAI